MQIVSWNVAGLRAMLKKDDFKDFFETLEYDIICLQETKAEEHQVKLPDYIEETYKFRFWNSSKGTTQRKGFSGTTIWSKIEPLNMFCSDFDQEGRICVIEFEKFRVVNVYVPNSQKFENDRYYFRQEWNKKFCDFIEILKDKEIIICGDLNVAHLDIDICNPKQKKNKIAGFFDFEREDYGNFIKQLDLLDIFRDKNPKLQKSTYWSNFLKSERNQENGWGIDYFLCSREIYKQINNLEIKMNILGSDHCPIVLDINSF